MSVAIFFFKKSYILLNNKFTNNVISIMPLIQVKEFDFIEQETDNVKSTMLVDDTWFMKKSLTLLHKRPTIILNQQCWWLLIQEKEFDFTKWETYG